MKIVIDTVDHANQRYPTAGDWIIGGDSVHIVVSRLDDPDMEFLVAVHELVEAWLCDKRGIPEPDVMAFDVDHGGEADPGGLSEAPYHKEHMFAETIERLLANELGVDWNVYTAKVEALFE